MRKNLLIGLIFFITINALYAQTKINYGDYEEPVPSVSSYSNYIDTPSSLASGVPNISIPLYSLSTNNKNISIPISLYYHPHNANEQSTSSDVGLGWSLYSSGVISRKIIEELDERYDDVSKSSYTKNKFDDVYYYNIPGYSGKFRFIRDVNNNTFTLKNLTNNKLKIEFNRTSNTATLILQSFTITNERGIKYIFNDYTTAYRSSPSGTNEMSIYYKSSFYLSKIIDENNIEQANFTYQKKSINSDGSNGASIHLLYEIYKLSTIETSFGKISFEYNYNQDLEYENINDPYNLVSILLLNKESSIISKYNFLYNNYYGHYFGQNNGKRILVELSKINNASQIIEKTKLAYDENGSETNYGNYGTVDFFQTNSAIHPKYKTLGLLKKITLPNKGSIVYNFEANEVFSDKTNYIANKEYIRDPSIEYIVDSNITFNTSQTNIYNLNIDVIRKIKVSFIVEENNNPIYTPRKPDLEPYQVPLDFSLKNSSGQVIYSFDYNSSDSNKSVLYTLDPGNYTLNVIGSGNGEFIISRIEANPKPYRNSTHERLCRIRNIKNFDSDGSQKDIVEYNYDLFTNPISPSSTRYSDFNSDFPTITYKNVSVKENNGVTGYTKYYFKTIADYPQSFPEYFYQPFYEIVNDGLLSKTEVYNSTNNIVKSIDINYTIEELPNAASYYISDENQSGTYTKPAWLKNKTEIVKEYGINNNVLQKTIETHYNINNYEVSSTKDTAPDGAITESFIKYAQDLSKDNLITANMISIPLETETKINNKTVSKTEIKYENTTTLFPSSVVSTNPNDSSTKTAIKYDSYDIKGNLVQYTTDYDSSSGTGNTVTIIWGYNKTQPIAKIEGAKLSDIGTLADDIVTKSNADIDTATENTLLIALDTFRNETSLKDYLITTYTYDPLIGVTTVTLPSGMRQIYKYDTDNRLKSVTDANGNIIKEMKYNNKQ